MRSSINIHRHWNIINRERSHWIELGSFILNSWWMDCHMELLMGLVLVGLGVVLAFLGVNQLIISCCSLQLSLWQSLMIIELRLHRVDEDLSWNVFSRILKHWRSKWHQVRGQRCIGMQESCSFGILGFLLIDLHIYSSYYAIIALWLWSIFILT